ncbi:AraC family transcriptional regulator [Paenibacillus sp. N4]|uniref:AraC family transcriptional regulator n=1 Tax=Paenibacillus vietnamensis TaxID=2590547 RepID=UPI001CD1360B|nr:AraC family transcriptional regulator [Paenibacillus vietnamensis]MCA0755373.1 AraC family transcriptional regulator [Paenibacillus vietnamensis]
MFQWSESEMRLNRYARLLAGDELTFHVHYWGVVRHLPANVPHRHSFYEHCYVAGGRGTYIDGDRTYLLHEGAVFCSRPDVMHQIRDVEQLDLLYVAFEPDEKLSDGTAFAEFTNAVNGGSVWLEGQSGSPHIQLWSSICVPVSGAGALPVTLLPQLAHGLLCSLPALLGTAGQTKQPRPSSDASLLIHRAKLYIRDNLASKLTLAEVAGYINVSERHMSRLFAGNILESFSALVRHERLRAAERLLIQSQAPIKEIAELCGFSSVHYFTRLFAEAKGIPPAAYRAAVQLQRQK